MKIILIILMFLPVLIQAQQSPETASEIKLLQYEDYFEDVGQDSAEYPIHFVDVSLPHRPFTWIADDCIHLIDLLEYQMECYNDSTRVWEHTFVPKSVLDCVYDYGCIHEHHYSFVIHHREPTFSGFIEWLKHKK